MKLLLAAAVAACLAVPALGCEDFDDIALAFADAGLPVVMIEADTLPLVEAEVETMQGDVGDVTRGFVVDTGQHILLGLEVDGCLIPPIFLGFSAPTEPMVGA